MPKEEKAIRLMAYLRLFPLMLACSFPQNSSAPFKPQYILPQLLLQYVKRNPDIDGIMFPSTKANYRFARGASNYNYVFPVRTLVASGPCWRLDNMFELTEPTSINLQGKENPGSYDAYNESPLKFIERVLDTRDLAKLAPGSHIPVIGIARHPLDDTQ